MPRNYSELSLIDFQMLIYGWALTPSLTRMLATLFLDRSEIRNAQSRFFLVIKLLDRTVYPVHFSLL